MTTEQSWRRTAGPGVEPITLAEAREHVRLAPTDTTHTNTLTRLIGLAREQVEMDTAYTLVNQTFVVVRDYFPGGDQTIKLPRRPVTSISSITYYDSDDTQQTIATTVYGLDLNRHIVYLKSNQSWPSVNGQHDGIVVTFIAGFGATAASVSYIFKHMMLLLIGKGFAQRDMTENMVFAGDLAYERLRKRVSRNSYP